jgi:hypothetical protein
MKRKALAIALLCSVSVSVALDIRPDFSGTWVPDATNSTINKKLKTTPDPNAPPSPPSPPGGSIYPIEKIEQKGTNVKISTLDDAGTTINAIVLSADGIEKVNDLGTVKHNSVTLWEERKLVTEWKLERDGAVFMQGKDTRELSEDDAVLTLRKHAEDSRSVSDMVIAFKRK